jgi:hypothetical protein
VTMKVLGTRSVPINKDNIPSLLIFIRPCETLSAVVSFLHCIYLIDVSFDLLQRYYLLYLIMCCNNFLVDMDCGCLYMSILADVPSTSTAPSTPVSDDIR